MRANHHEMDALLKAGGGLIIRREHMPLANSLAHLVRAGRLRRILPGVYVRPELADDPWVRMRAAAAWDPNAVLAGEPPRR